ncbi:MAG: YebC/PmpR family DNA-binding transcriptional regulator [Fidelibacterota bacterium]
MAGHSKWAQIKRKKAVQDARRGQVFTRLIREITVAARLGGGDENGNPRLRKAVAQAKEANMPAQNIKRAIQRGTGELPGVSYEEAVFEGYGPGGVALIIEVLTDNRKRTVAFLRHLFSKYGGNLGEPGCVAWMFDKEGRIWVKKNGVDEDSLLECVVEGQGRDYVEQDDGYEISSSPEVVESLREHLEKNRFRVEKIEVALVPKNSVAVEGENARKLLKLMDELEDYEDIQRFSSNFDVDESVLMELD